MRTQDKGGRDGAGATAVLDTPFTASHALEDMDTLLIAVGSIAMIGTTLYVYLTGMPWHESRRLSAAGLAVCVERAGGALTPASSSLLQSASFCSMCTAA